MPRPTPPPHPVALFLAEHHPGEVADATSKKYAAVLRRMEKTQRAPAAWLKAQVTQLDGSKKRASRMTLGVYRSAVFYYLVWQHFDKTGEVLDLAEAHVRFSDTLVSVSAGVKGEERGALSAKQYETYVQTVLNAATYVQVKAVLLLLPLTGMRISEACYLKGENVLRHGSEWTLSFRGKGDKHRTVPLSDAAQQLVEPFVEAAESDDDYIFTNPLFGLPGSVRLELSPAQVRAEVRSCVQSVEGLEDVTPHILRHHAATESLRAGVDVMTLKALLGHSSTKTLERYAHPDEDMKRAAMSKLSGGLQNTKLG